MKQFFAIYYRNILVGQISAPVETTEIQARQIMIDNLWKAPGLLDVKGYTTEETASMLRHGVLKTYPLPQCKTPTCQMCH